MPQFKNQPSFRELMENCTDQASPYWEAAWQEFANRYHQIIYRYVTNRCLNWKSARVRNQISDIVNDIVPEVYIILQNKLNTYRDFNEEKSFPFWLATISNRAAANYLKRHFKAAFINVDLENLVNYFNDFEFDTQFELYEYMVVKFRSIKKRTNTNIERDIHIFYLYIWETLPYEMILKSHPCCTNLGNRAIDNVVYRLRKILRNDSNF